ncbi:MAG: hypothetical protein WBN96_10335 [Gammaproteobacteria bacterium]
MEPPKTPQNNTAKDTGSEHESAMENTEKKKFGRRLQDAITSKDPKRKLNLDRRAVNSDRRTERNPGYQGQALRFTIDRRRNLKDRRKKD